MRAEPQTPTTGLYESPVPSTKERLAYGAADVPPIRQRGRASPGFRAPPDPLVPDCDATVTPYTTTHDPGGTGRKLHRSDKATSPTMASAGSFLRGGAGGARQGGERQRRTSGKVDLSQARRHVKGIEGRPLAFTWPSLYPPPLHSTTFHPLRRAPQRLVGRVPPGGTSRDNGGGTGSRRRP